MTLSRRYASIGMVAFVDLLGYSARIQAASSLEDLASIERDVRRAQLWFDHRTSDSIIRDVQKLQSKKVLAFSDCLVIAVPSTSEMAIYEGEYDVLLGEIVALASAQGRCAVNGIFLRGGIDYGFWYKRRDTIISPALLSAYDLERVKAVVPMFAVGDAFIERFRDHAQRGFYSESDDPFPKYFREFDLPDGRRQWMVDYLPLLLGETDGVILRVDRQRYSEEDAGGRERMRAVAQNRSLRIAIVAHRDSIVAAHAAADTDAVRGKFEWLAAYHDDALRRFLVEPPAEALIGTLPGRTS